MIQESYDWIVNCIYSCRNDFHLKCCDKLIVLFEYQFKDHTLCKSLTTDLITDLKSQEITICVEV